MWLGVLVLALGLIMLILLLVYFIMIVRNLKLGKIGLFIYLFLGREWFLIRSPNRNRFFILSFTSIGALACLGVIAFSFKPAPFLELGVGFIVFTILTAAIFFMTKKKIIMEKKKSE